MGLFFLYNDMINFFKNINDSKYICDCLSQQNEIPITCKHSVLKVIPTVVIASVSATSTKRTILEDYYFVEDFRFRHFIIMHPQTDEEYESEIMSLCSGVGFDSRLFSLTESSFLVKRHITFSNASPFVTASTTLSRVQNSSNNMYGTGTKVTPNLTLTTGSAPSLRGRRFSNHIKIAGVKTAHARRRHSAASGERIQRQRVEAAALSPQCLAPQCTARCSAHSLMSKSHASANSLDTDASSCGSDSRQVNPRRSSLYAPQGGPQGPQGLPHLRPHGRLSSILRDFSETQHKCPNFPDVVPLRPKCPKNKTPFRYEIVNLTQTKGEKTGSDDRTEQDKSRSKRSEFKLAEERFASVLRPNTIRCLLTGCLVCTFIVVVVVFILFKEMSIT